MTTQLSSAVKPAAYLLAASMRDAEITARSDWGWQPSGRHMFRTYSGELVHLISSGRHLRGVPKGTKIYLGFQWQEAPESNYVVKMIRAGMLVEGKPEIPV